MQARWKLRCLRDVHDLYYTHDNDTFKDVCIATKLDKALWQVYYSWVHEEFMRGELFNQRTAAGEYKYPGGVGFQNPFQKGVRYKKLPDDVSFPMPKGPLWERKLDSIREKSASNDDSDQISRQLYRSAYVQAVYDTCGLHPLFLLFSTNVCLILNMCV